MGTPLYQLPAVVEAVAPPGEWDEPSEPGFTQYAPPGIDDINDEWDPSTNSTRTEVHTQHFGTALDIVTDVDLSVDVWDNPDLVTSRALALSRSYAVPYLWVGGFKMANMSTARQWFTSGPIFAYWETSGLFAYATQAGTYTFSAPGVTQGEWFAFGVHIRASDSIARITTTAGSYERTGAGGSLYTFTPTVHLSNGAGTQNMQGRCAEVSTWDASFNNTDFRAIVDEVATRIGV